MTQASDLLNGVRKALASAERVDVRRHRIIVELDGDTIVLDGEVESVAAKQLALEAVAAAAPGARHIIDRLHVAPAVHQADGEILDHVGNSLIAEPALADTAVHVRAKGHREPVRVPDAARGTIEVSVENGVVTLDGEVPGLGRKRLAGLFGVDRVVNHILVRP